MGTKRRDMTLFNTFSSHSPGSVHPQVFSAGSATSNSSFCEGEDARGRHCKRSGHQQSGNSVGCQRKDQRHQPCYLQHLDLCEPGRTD
eukprot:jgi/Botrbrau1/22813/Bobra.0132s0137.1